MVSTESVFSVRYCEICYLDTCPCVEISLRLRSPPDVLKRKSLSDILLTEIDDFLVELDEDVEGMQSTIYILQQQLKEAREEISKLGAENQQLRTSAPTLAPCLEAASAGTITDATSGVEPSSVTVVAESELRDRTPGLCAAVVVEENMDCQESSSAFIGEASADVDEVPRKKLRSKSPDIVGEPSPPASPDADSDRDGPRALILADDETDEMTMEVDKMRQELTCGESEAAEAENDSVDQSSS